MGHQKVKKKCRSRRDEKPEITLAWIWGARGVISRSFSKTKVLDLLLFWNSYSLCSAFLEILLTLQPFTRNSDSICSATFANPTHSAALWPSEPWDRPCFDSWTLEAIGKTVGRHCCFEGSTFRPPPRSRKTTTTTKTKT